MDYYVNPWIFYGVETLHNLRCILGDTTVLALVILVVCSVWYVNTEKDHKYVLANENWHKPTWDDYKDEDANAKYLYSQALARYEDYKIRKTGVIQTLKRISRYIKHCLIVITIGILGYIAIPSEKTMYRMLVASYLTKSNVEIMFDTIDHAADKLVEKIIKVKEK